MHRPFSHHAIAISNSYYNYFKYSYIEDSKKAFRKSPNKKKEFNESDKTFESVNFCHLQLITVQSVGS